MGFFDDCYDDCAPALITSCDTSFLCGVTTEVFCSLTQPVKYYKYTVNDEEAHAWGSARPTFELPVTTGALVDREPNEQNKTYWGNDERTRAVITLLFAQATALGVTNRDLFELDGERLAITKTFDVDWIEGSALYLVIRLVPVDHKATYNT